MNLEDALDLYEEGCRDYDSFKLEQARTICAILTAGALADLARGLPVIDTGPR